MVRLGPGVVVLIRFPFSDLSSSKLRPAVVLARAGSVEAPKAQMARHLAACAPEHDSGAGNEILVQLLIEASGAPEYWLHVEGREDASLDQLDRLVRSTWLECCGHMSAFYVRGVEPAKRSRLGSVFRTKGTPFQYEYDFGSTTALKGKVIAAQQ